MGSSKQRATRRFARETCRLIREAIERQRDVANELSRLSPDDITPTRFALMRKQLVGWIGTNTSLLESNVALIELLHRQNAELESNVRYCNTQRDYQTGDSANDA
jgi:hypothetical protein